MKQIETLKRMGNEIEPEMELLGLYLHRENENNSSVCFPECEVDLAKIHLSYVLEPDKRFLHLFYTTYVL
jgi:hypothetical protein